MDAEIPSERRTNKQIILEELRLKIQQIDKDYLKKLVESTPFRIFELRLLQPIVSRPSSSLSRNPLTLKNQKSFIVKYLLSRCPGGRATSFSL